MRDNGVYSGAQCFVPAVDLLATGTHFCSLHKQKGNRGIETKLGAEGRHHQPDSRINGPGQRNSS